MFLSCSYLLAVGMKENRFKSEGLIDLASASLKNYKGMRFSLQLFRS